jgi:hypothetical protein
MAVSLNVLAMPQPDIPALLTWMQAAKPPYAVVMDGLELAARIRMVSPDTTIIHRKYRTDDHKLHETISPTEFLDSVADVPAAFICQCLNEPGGDQAQLAQWCAALIRLADLRGRRLALPNWSVGNPDDEMIAAGVYDPLLKALADSGKHLLATHEYFHDKPAEEWYFVGRYHHFLRRADTLGISRPEIVITEHGRDLGGGTNDGWRGQGWSEADYARRLDEAQTVYAPDGITACVFSYGAGFDQRWQSFNVEGAPDLLRAMEAMNVGREEEDVGLPGWAQAKTKTAGASVNVRNAPAITAPVVSTVKTDDWTKKIGTPIRNGQYTWQQVILNEPNKCVHGYVALEVITV